MTPEQAGWAILTSAVIFGGELIVWYQAQLDRSRRRFVRDIHRVLRSRTPGGSGTAGLATPRGRSVVVGVERRIPQRVTAPPAPCHLVGAVTFPQPAPTRPPRMYAACGYSWGSDCRPLNGGSHSCVWPSSECVGHHRCVCGAGTYA